MDIDLRIKILLGLQVALLGEITPNIRGISCSWDKSLINIYCDFDGEISDDNRESMECVSSELIAQLPNHKVSVYCQRLDLPEPLNSNLYDWVYRRKE